MCGIVGILDLTGAPVDVDDLRRMNAAIRHRGPDDQGYFVAPGIGLGMSRLSIIDLANGRQPIRNEDGTVWVVFNGEIYNYRELRSRLEGLGHVFRTASDTETIVHAYEEWGDAFVDHLRGMFGLAVWDANRQRLVLARDRIGIKPLYWGVVGGRLLFASELKAILQLRAVDRRVDPAALEHLLAGLTTPPDRSIIDGIHKLEPGRMVTAGPGESPRVRRYWELEHRPEHGRDDDWFVDRLLGLLDECVSMHMVSDVPVGAFLSGGIDSSAVVATMTRHAADPVRTYSIGFAESDFDESADARMVAEHLGTDHHAMIVAPDVAELLDDITWHLDEPFGDSSAIPTYMVSQLAARDLKVVLTGDGGDELFAGYDDYVWEKNERYLRFVPMAVRKMIGAISSAMPTGMKGRNFLRHVSLDEYRRPLDHGVLYQQPDRKGLLHPEIRERVSDYDPLEWQEAQLRAYDGHWLSGLQRFDLEAYLPMDVLTKVDRMSMAHSIETRVPLLDHKLAEFAATIPPERLLRRGSQKYALRKAMRGILPDHTLDKPKQGFAVPLGLWIKKQLRPLVDDLLLSDSLRRRQLLEPRMVERFVRMHRAGGDLDLQIWTLMSLELWARRFLDDTTVTGPWARTPDLQPHEVAEGTIWQTRQTA